MNDSLVTIATYLFSLRAYLTKGRLESQGIECFLFNENFRYGAHVNLEEGIELRVRQEDYDKAMLILEDIKSEHGDDVLNDHGIDIEKILVPVYLSGSETNICEYAIDLALMFSAEITLFHTYHLPDIHSIANHKDELLSSTIDEHLFELKSKAVVELNSINGLIKKLLVERNLTSDIKVNIRLEQGFPVDEIYRFYKEYDPDIIVMGAGISGNNTHNNIAAEIIENVKIPVLAIPEDSVCSLKNLNNVMYLTNFDDSDFRAIHKLLYLLSPFNVNIHYVHVSEFKDEWDTLKLEGLKEHMKKEYISSEIEVGVIQDSDLLKGCNKYILENKIDIVAMVSHKRTLLSRMVKKGLPRKILINTNTPLFAFH